MSTPYARDREIDLLSAENKRLREALEWYEAKVKWCNNFTQLGEDARNALAMDRGERARKAFGGTGEEI